MTADMMVLLVCLLTDTAQTHLQKSYQPYGPKMCEALYQNRANKTLWEFDEVQLVCKQSSNSSDGRGQDDSRNHLIHARRSGSKRTTDTSLHGFIMHTSRALVYVDLAMRRHKLFIGDHQFVDCTFYYDGDDNRMYMLNLNSGIIYQGVISNMRVNFTRYRQIKDKIVNRIAVDKTNNMVALIHTSTPLKLHCYNTTAGRARRVAEEVCSCTTIVLHTHTRLVYFVQRFKLCSMDYRGHDKLIYNKINIRKSFYLEFQDEQISCNTRINKKFVKYMFDRTSEKIRLTRRPLKCTRGNKAAFSYVIKVEEMIIAALEQNKGILVLNSRKCVWMFKHVPVAAVFRLE